MNKIQHQNTIVFKKQLEKCNRGVSFFPCPDEWKIRGAGSRPCLVTAFFWEWDFSQFASPWMCCLLEELSKYKQIRKCNVASFEKEKNQLRKCDVASCKKNATQKMQRWKLHFFCIFCCICFGAVPCFFAFFRFFFVKQYKSWSKLQKNATEKMQRRKLQEKMQRRKCNVGSCFFLHFLFRYFWHLHFPLHF